MWGVKKMIKKVGDMWYLYDSEGRKVLGKHKSRKDAVKQEIAINMSKARAAGHNIPKKKGQ